MRTRWVALAAILTTSVAVALGLFPTTPFSARAGALNEGRQLYDTRCASCHGLKLEGQPNWMERRPDGRLPAPPHDASGHTWHHSDRQLFHIVRDGLATIAPGYETDMKAFVSVLTDEQIRAVLDYIKSTWPLRQQEIQAARSAVDPET